MLLTLHRAENVDDPQRLAARLAALALDRPVIFPVHPRTRASMKRAGIRLPGNVVAIDPVGYLEMVALETHALAIATDSGGVQKEAYLSAVPCITLRAETEWVETVEAGWNRLAGTEPSAVANALSDPDFMDGTRPRPPLHGDGRSAARIVAALEGLNMQWKAAAANPATRREPMEAARP